MGKKVEQSNTTVETQENNDPSLKCSVFVSGLPYSADTDAIKEYFSNCGTIENIKLPRYQDTGKIIGYCHIVFSTPEEAQEAIKLNKQVMNGRYLDISLAKGEKKIEYKSDVKSPEDCTTIFVKNLAFDCTEDEVGELFEKCGKVVNIRFVYHHSQKHFKGFAFIEFKMNSSVNAALKLNGTEFKGRKLTIDYEVGSMKKGFRFKQTQDGNQKYNKQYDDIVEEKEKKQKKIQKFDKLKNFNQKKKDFPQKGKKDNLKLFKK
ncbi:hypothetical protein ABPG74_008516 [Tetrahymena malaccensis]